VSASAQDLLARCRFPPPDPDRGTLALAVSGGPDSTAMALLGVEAGLPVELWHVDHGARPDSAADVATVAELADRLDVPLRTRTVTVTSGPAFEARARAARYDVLPADVCVGHTADDRAETVLINLLRGAGPQGVAAGFAMVSRPILGLRRAETVALCADRGISVLTDPMNADPAFARVAVRTQVMPLIAEIFDRDPVPLLNRHADLTADVHAVVVASAASIDPTDTASLTGVAPAVAREALRAWIAAETGAEASVDAASIDRVMAVVRHEVRAAEIVGGHRVARTAGVLRIERA